MWRALCKFGVLSPKNAPNNFFRKISNSYIDINEEVRHALHCKKPVVALESTIITHGMPYPTNLECAMEVETIVKQRGATPATIAILGGKVKVGLTGKELTELAEAKVETVKMSRRDFGYVLANKCNGGTTIAGTLIVANEAGIPVFATGGLGGVHREAEKTFDISADLTELGKTPVAVVASGVKSILDIAKTLEYLETQGVFVATFGENRAFPAFYCRSSGCEAPYFVRSAKEAADIISSHLGFGLKSGLLFAVPVPEKYAMNEEEMNDVIERAMVSAKKAGVTGKALTPYLLTHIAEITEGTSLKTNIAFIKHNASVGADIAVELAQLQQHGGNEHVGLRDAGIKKQPVVIGGSIIDCCATLKGKDISLDGRIHNAKLKFNAGGVGRNITEAMSKLGCPPAFISVVGNDTHGQYLCSLLPPQSSRTVQKLPDGNTAQCIIVFDCDGDCKMLIGDMDVHQRITADMVNSYEERISKSPLLVLDANLSLEALEAALKLAEKHKVPVFFEPTDVPIAGKPFETPHWKAIKYITPNLLELKQIAQTLGIQTQNTCANHIDEAATIAKLVTNYVPNVIVTLSSDGLLIARKSLATDPLLQSGYVRNEVKIRHYRAEKAPNLINVSGAGDCLASGLIVAMLSGLSEQGCIKVGFAAARAALFSPSAVPDVLFDKRHVAWSSIAQYRDLN